ncbi:MAG: hypothetical protein JST87_17665 [Bacteroidetes bacterium]|nr:hypothetical protein [Bacteroidota bacterium]MBS1932950.1 hypothetical protein [Bacteroidota bacterium]
MITKQKILETIKAMPEENFDDLEVVIERLVLLEKIQKGIEQAERGETISIDELKEEMKLW